MQERLIGADALVERLLIGLVADGHLLLEGAPGLAKTRAVKRLAGASESHLRAHSMHARPDARPTSPARRSGGRTRASFEFSAGPIFHSLLLVDEINRAPPKVQSALLEAMAERQVTIAGATHALPDPFMIVATQNPIEHEGTFPLPEAQLDRFMLHVESGSAGRRHRAAHSRSRRAREVSKARRIGAAAALQPEEIAAARQAARSVYLSAGDQGLHRAPRHRAARCERRAGAGGARSSIRPRRAARWRSPRPPRRAPISTGATYAAPQDVSELAVDVLSHRTILGWRAIAEGETPRGVIRAYLDTVSACMSAAEAPVLGVDLDVESLMRLRLLSTRSSARRAARLRRSAASARRRRGRGAETYDVRPWSDGDDMRSLDRNVTARTGAPHVRTFHDERERSVLFLVDFRAPMLFGTRRAFRSVAAAEAAVASAWRVINSQGRVGLAAIGSAGARCFGWAVGARSFPPLLVALAEAHRAALSESAEAAEPSLALRWRKWRASVEHRRSRSPARWIRRAKLSTP